jgi:hypothetical protein
MLLLYSINCGGISSATKIILTSTLGYNLFQVLTKIGMKSIYNGFKLTEVSTQSNIILIYIYQHIFIYNTRAAKKIKNTKTHTPLYTHTHPK